MPEPATQPGPLAGYRVLDLTDEMGAMATKLLADLGAEVIVVEPPGGHPLRERGPFYHGQPDPEKSLAWFTFQTNKKSVILDIATPAGRDLLLELVERSDFLFESSPPGHLASLGLGYEAASARSPGLIYVSITPFGQSGPYAGYRATDIVGVAMGGLQWTCGDEDRPPVRVGASQAYANAGAQAAYGALMALWHRGRTGQGQWVDVSMQEAVAVTLDTQQQSWDLLKMVLRRVGGYRDFGDGKSPLVYETADGYVSCSAQARVGWKPLVDWMDSYGMAGDLKSDQYYNHHQRGLGQRLSPEESDYIQGLLRPFIKRFPTQEFYQQAQARRIFVCPANSARDLVESVQFQGRGFFVQAEHLELGESLTYPGAPYRFSATPWALRRRAPTLGEDTSEVLGTLPGKTSAKRRAGGPRGAAAPGPRAGKTTRRGGAGRAR